MNDKLHSNLFKSRVTDIYQVPVMHNNKDKITHAEENITRFPTKHDLKHSDYFYSLTN